MTEPRFENAETLALSGSSRPKGRRGPSRRQEKGVRFSVNSSLGIDVPSTAAGNAEICYGMRLARGSRSEN